uniref:PAS domain-containing protein n=1 Tax=Actinomadura roseirufa TaxID=2094049 RepID=UPI00104142DD
MGITASQPPPSRAGGPPGEPSGTPPGRPPRDEPPATVPDAASRTVPPPLTAPPDVPPPDAAVPGDPLAADAHPPRFLGQHMLGVARMAVIALNGHGRVSHWNQAAVDLFGVGRTQAIGRPLSLLLRLPQEHRGAFETKAFGHVWCGASLVPRVDNGELAEVGWWVYPIDPPGHGDGLGGVHGGVHGGGSGGGQGIRVLALAADLRRLREDGPGLSLGDVLVAAPDGTLRQAAGARLLRVEPTLAPPSDQ